MEVVGSPQPAVRQLAAGELIIEKRVVRTGVDPGLRERERVGRGEGGGFGLGCAGRLGPGHRGGEHAHGRGERVLREGRRTTLELRFADIQGHVRPGASSVGVGRAVAPIADLLHQLDALALKEALEERGMSIKELAKQSAISIAIINGFIGGSIKLTKHIACELEKALDIPATFWRNRERNYRKFMKQKIKAYYKDLKEVYEKHGIYICGCCGAWPVLIEERSTKKIISDYGESLGIGDD